ncbi:MAG: ScpA family protein [Pseudomonadota bacterium]
MSALIQDAALDAAAAKAEDADQEDAFLVDIEGFEGPLHLLLALARKQKVDLLRVSILELAEQYLAFILEAKSKRVDLAADYLLMASWLAYLKSRLLLPKPETIVDDEPDGEGMAARLAFRLARLNAMRDAMQALQAGNVSGRDVFTRGAPERPKIVKTRKFNTELYDVMTSFANIYERKAKTQSHVVQRPPVLALEAARQRLKGVAPSLDNWEPIRDLPPPIDLEPETPAKSILASFFSAALELTRDRAVDMRQDAPLSDVYVRRAGVKSDTRKAAE